MEYIYSLKKLLNNEKLYNRIRKFYIKIVGSTKEFHKLYNF